MPADSPPRPLTATFLLSAGQLAGCPPPDAPEVAFVGRSNAGKSSALNRLAGQRGLARVSKTPGRTQLLNFFAVAGGGRLVDLPGYGFASAPKTRRDAWGRAVDAYLNRRVNLAGVVLVMDIRHPLRAADQQLVAWGASTGTPLLALLSKADKLKRGPRLDAARGVEQTLREASAAAQQPAGLVPFSALTGLGLAEALAVIRAWLGGGVVGERSP